MNLIRYILDFFHINGAGQQAVKYAKGQAYPATEETLSHVVAGIAEVVSDATLAVKDFVEGNQAPATPSAPVATTLPIIDPVAATPSTDPSLVVAQHTTDPAPTPVPEPQAAVPTATPTDPAVAVSQSTATPAGNTADTAPPTLDIPATDPVPTPVPRTPVAVPSATVTDPTPMAAQPAAVTVEPVVVPAATLTPVDAPVQAAPVQQAAVSAAAGTDPSVVVPQPASVVTPTPVANS